MKSGAQVVAYVGRTWLVVVVLALLLGLGIWGVGFAVYQQMLAAAAYLAVIVFGTVVSTGLLLGFRVRADVTSDGLLITSPYRSRTIGWADIVEVDLVLARTWVRCRDSGGRVSVVLATSAWHPRTNLRVRRENEALATLLRHESLARRDGISRG